MKKIVAVATLASVLAGATFAADISFSYTGSNFFKSNGDNISYANDLRTDCMSFGLSNDYAGAIVDFDIEEGNLKLDQYYGWMNFAAISTQFTAGVWTSRYVDRVDTDKGDLKDEDFELYKPGIICHVPTSTTNSAPKYSVAVDSDNLTKNLSNEKVLAMAAAYTNHDVVPGALMIKLGLANSAWDSFTKTDTDGTYTRTNSYGFFAEAAVRADNLANVNLAIKSYHVGKTSLALFFSPLMVEKLQATVGFTLGLDTYTLSERNGNDSDKTGAEFAADFRLRYALTDKLSFTTMHNFSSYLSGTEADGAGQKWSDNKKAMWNMINVTYAFLDNMKFGLTLNHVISDFDTAYPDASKIIVSPSVAIQATEKAKVTVAARGTFDKIGLPGNHYSDFTFVVPVIFSFNY